MDMLKKVFPFSFNVKEKDVTSLIVSIIIYLVVSIAVGVVMWVLNFIPVLNILTGIVGWLAEVYCLAGIVLAVLKFLNVLK